MSHMKRLLAAGWKGRVTLAWKGNLAISSQHPMTRLPPAKSWSPSLSQRMLAILAASVIAVAAPAALVFYFFTRDASIAEAEQFAATSADRRILGLNYTLRLASTSLARFDLMLHDRLAFSGTAEEVSRLRSVLERNDAGMLVTPASTRPNRSANPCSRAAASPRLFILRTIPIYPP